MTSKTNQDWCLTILEFLNRIGIPARAVEGSEALAKAFTPHVLIKNGGLEVDIQNVCPGDILHEAGHIAVLPAPFRHLASGTLGKAHKAMEVYMRENPGGLATWPEDPVSRCILQSGEDEATAWQYAAAVEVGLPDDLLYPEGSFQGFAKENLIGFKLGEHLGIHGLRTAGWTSKRYPAPKPGMPPVFPKLAFWLHPAGAEAQPA